MNTVIRIGPLGIPIILLGIILALASGRFLLFMMKSEKKEARAILESFTSALIYGFLVWKISVLFTHFPEILKTPLLILYAPGGILGLILGIITALVYLGFRIKHLLKAPASQRNQTLKQNGLFLTASVIVFGIFALINNMVTAAEIKNEVKDITRMVKTFSGDEIRLGNLPQKIIILNFWATWCLPCRAEIPELKRFYKDLDTDKAAFYAVNLTSSEENPENIPIFMKDMNVDFPVIMDPYATLSQEFEITTIPATYIITNTGQVKAVHQGVVTREWLQGFVP